MKPTTKIFCIGFQKTGTTSLGGALQMLGFSVCGVRYDFLPCLREGNIKRITDVVRQYDAFKDNPWPVLYQHMDTHFPGSKFILTLREESSWLRSLINHFNTTPSDMQLYIYGKPCPKGNEQLYLETYRTHNREVLAHFNQRPEDLLTIDLTKESSWEKICSFLAVPIPAVPFPHQNRGKYTWYGKLIKYGSKKWRLLLKKLRIFQEED
ncbi:MAG: sulfotransferase family protein [Saprospiraceae bacterium]